jgi:hypothetical protein
LDLGIQGCFRINKTGRQDIQSGKTPVLALIIQAKKPDLLAFPGTQANIL